MFRHGEIKYRSGTSFAIGTIIDGHIDDDLCEILYKKWKDSWGEKLMFHGGTTAITAEMILEAPIKELNRAYGKKVTLRLLNAAQGAI